MRKPLGPTQEEAETLAIRMVGALAHRPELLQRFLALAGISPDDLRSRLGEPALLGAVLDFVLYDEALTRELAAALDVPPEFPALARRQLPGAAPSD